MDKARIVAWDIESTGLKADFAFLLCAAFGTIGEDDVKLLSLSQYGGSRGNPLRHEKRLVKDVLDEMAKADILVSYYGTGFDHPYMNAKALEYGFPLPPPIPRVDLYFTAKSNLAISRKSMENVARVANAPHGKTPVEGWLWKAAAAGDREALKAIEQHNIDDIKVLKDVYESLRPLVRTHPYVGDKRNCTCGEPVQRRGKAYTKTVAQHYRFVCRNGHWSSRALTKAEKDAQMFNNTHGVIAGL